MSRPQRIRIVHLADPHFGCEDEAAAESAIAAVRALSPDLTVIAGDLTFEGRGREFVAASAWLARLPHPQIVTPGNHDTPVWNLALRLFAPFARFRAYVGLPGGEVALPGLLAQSLNTARGVQARLDWSKGVIDLEETRRAIAAMAGAGDALKVLVCHHPLIEAEGAKVSGGVRRGRAAARLFAEGGVDLVLSGHVHEPFVRALPWGDGFSLSVGAGTLSRRTRGAPPCFTLIDALPERLEISVQQWTGRDFVAVHAKSFARRPARAEALSP